MNNMLAKYSYWLSTYLFADKTLHIPLNSYLNHCPMQAQIGNGFNYNLYILSSRVFREIA
jgi:hypothetical protein